MNAHGFGSRSVLAAFLLSSLPIPVVRAQSWWREVADPGDVGGLYASVAMEGTTQHVTYYDATKGDLRYKRFFDPPEVVDASGNVGQFSSLALDASHTPHVAYYDATQRDLKYATKVGGAWQRETVDAPGSVGLYAALALKPVHGATVPCISYFDLTNGHLKYACKGEIVPGTWTVAVVDTSAEVGAHTSLAFDTAGHAHIAYYDGGAHALRYATDASGTWATQVVDSSANVGQHTSIKVDALGTPHISYHDATNLHLKYARSVHGAWVVETVDAAVGTGQYTSLALDASGEPHIAYYDSANKDLKYATKSGATWTISTLLTSGDVGSYASLALLDGEDIFITYFDKSYGCLRYAYKRVSWSESFSALLDGFARVGIESSSARDSIDRPHVAYVDWTHAKLKYAVKSGSTWTQGVIDAGGSRPSLAVDPADGVRVSYRRDDGLWYASKTAGGWVREQVDTGSDIGRTSLALTASGSPAIAYVKGFDVKYAVKLAEGWWSIDTVGGGDAVALVMGSDGWPRLAYTGPWSGLRYARKVSFGWPTCTNIWGCWVSELVDAGGAGPVSLALDASGTPHLSYQRDFPASNFSDFAYATKSGGAWSLQVIEAASAEAQHFGLYSDVALDPAGLPHFAYLAQTGDGTHAPVHTMLRHARMTAAGGFILDLVDASEPRAPLDGLEPPVGYHPSLTMAAGGTPCVTYEDDRNDPVLKHACFF